jgi:raffinose/stachyose/melibiose transport system permease protein
MDKVFRDKKAIAIFVLPGLLLYLIMFVIPIVATGYISFFDWRVIGEMKFIGIDNYIKLFTTDPLFWKGVKNTFILFFILLVAQIPPALVFSLLLHHHTKGLRFFKTVYFIPMMISAVAIAILWNKVYEPNFGILNEILRFLGLQEQLWLSDPDMALVAVCLSIAWQGIGFHFILLYSGLKGIPETYYEAAKIDGANSIVAIWHITLPLLRDIIKVCIVMAAIGAMKIFDQVYVMTGGGPINSTMTVAMQMYQEAFSKTQYGYGSAIAIFLLIECLLIAYVLNKVLTKESIEF